MGNIYLKINYKGLIFSLFFIPFLNGSSLTPKNDKKFKDRLIFNTQGNLIGQKISECMTY